MIQHRNDQMPFVAAATFPALVSCGSERSRSVRALGIAARKQTWTLVSRRDNPASEASMWGIGVGRGRPFSEDDFSENSWVGRANGVKKGGLQCRATPRMLGNESGRQRGRKRFCRWRNRRAGFEPIEYTYIHVHGKGDTCHREELTDGDENDQHRPGSV